MLSHETIIQPHRSRLSRVTRLGVAALAGTALAFLATGVATADPRHRTPTMASVTTTPGLVVSVTVNGRPETQMASLITFTAEGQQTPSRAYCIDYHNPLGSVGYTESTWTDSKVEDLPKILWILQHSYPTVAPAQVAAAAGAEVSALQTASLESVVYAATQVAIWYFSDDVTLTDTNPTLVKIYEYLTDKKTNTGVTAEPKSLTITPESATAAVGEKAGPFTLSNSTGATSLAVTGGKAVDKDGNDLTSLTGDGQFWLTSPTEGTVTVTATGPGILPAGRVFTGPLGAGGKSPQKIILAGKLPHPQSAMAKATFTAAKPILPVTGASAAIAAATGLVLLGTGVALVMVRRRRQVRFTV